MSICIKNATLISMDNAREKIERNIDILIKGQKIEKVGKNIKIDNNVSIIDASGKIVMPGLINTHAHVPMSIFRETLDGYNLQDWLIKKIWPMEAKLKGEDVYYASYLSFLEMIKTGCTTINDMYFFTEESIKAMQETGIRLQTTQTLRNISGDDEGDKKLEELKYLIDKYSKLDSKLTFNAGIHGLYTSNERYVKKCIEFAENNDIGINMHFCENAEEVRNIKELYKASPIEVLERNFKDVHTILAHCVKIDKVGIERMKKMNISVSHCPVSNLKLGCGIARINDMLNEGINVSLGTDGQGSGSNLDLFETMKYTALLQKGLMENPEVLPAYEVLKMATINGAKALGMEKIIGSVTKGKYADLIIIDTDNILQKPQNDLISQIVYNVKGSDVSTTIVDGSMLMNNKKLIEKLDEKGICDKCKEIIDRITKNK